MSPQTGVTLGVTTLPRLILGREVHTEHQDPSQPDLAKSWQTGNRRRLFCGVKGTAMDNNRWDREVAAIMLHRSPSIGLDDLHEAGDTPRLCAPSSHSHLLMSPCVDPGRRCSLAREDSSTLGQNSPPAKGQPRKGFPYAHATTRFETAQASRIPVTTNLDAGEGALPPLFPRTPSARIARSASSSFEKCTCCCGEAAAAPCAWCRAGNSLVQIQGPQSMLHKTASPPSGDEPTEGPASLRTSLAQRRGLSVRRLALGEPGGQRSGAAGMSKPGRKGTGSGGRGQQRPTITMAEVEDMLQLNAGWVHRAPRDRGDGEGLRKGQERARARPVNVNAARHVSTFTNTAGAPVNAFVWALVVLLRCCRALLLLPFHVTAALCSSTPPWDSAARTASCQARASALDDGDDLAGMEAVRREHEEPLSPWASSLAMEALFQTFTP